MKHGNPNWGRNDLVNKGTIKMRCTPISQIVSENEKSFTVEAVKNGRKYLVHIPTRYTEIRESQKHGLILRIPEWMAKTRPLLDPQKHLPKFQSCTIVFRGEWQPGHQPQDYIKPKKEKGDCAKVAHQNPGKEKILPKQNISPFPPLNNKPPSEERLEQIGRDARKRLEQAKVEGRIIADQVAAKRARIRRARARRQRQNESG